MRFIENEKNMYLELFADLDHVPAAAAAAEDAEKFIQENRERK